MFIHYSTPTIYIFTSEYTDALNHSSMVQLDVLTSINSTKNHIRFGVLKTDTFQKVGDGSQS
jgi:hypothetical protein